jgi:phage/plasmid primase-like uncharacterized protein
MPTSPHLSREDAVQEFADALRDAGLKVRGSPVMDGKMHKVPVEGAKPGNTSGRYIGHLDDNPSGWFKNWKTGEEGNWKPSGPTQVLTTAEREKLRERAAREARQKDLERLEREAGVSQYAERRWDAAQPAPDSHPYLRAKGVLTPEMRVDSKGHLLVPLRDVGGKLWSLQTISPEGEKHFLSGGRTKGMFAVLGQIQNGEPYAIAEGLATAASVRQSTGLTTVVAFNAGNLQPVAESLHARFPESDIIIAADNDHHLPRQLSGRGEPMKNVGVEKAHATTQVVNGAIVVPEFPRSSAGNDWNDYEAEHGPAGVRESFAVQLRVQGRNELAGALLAELGAEQQQTNTQEEEVNMAEAAENAIGNQQGAIVAQMEATYIENLGRQTRFGEPPKTTPGEIAREEEALSEHTEAAEMPTQTKEVAEQLGEFKERVVHAEAAATGREDLISRRLYEFAQRLESAEQRADALEIPEPRPTTPVSWVDIPSQPEVPRAAPPAAAPAAATSSSAPSSVAEQAGPSTQERITVRGILGQMGGYVQQSINDVREYYEKKILELGALLAPPLTERPDPTQPQATANSKHNLTEQEYQRATEQAKETQTLAQSQAAAERTVPEASWHKEAKDLVSRIAKLESALFPGAAVVTMDPASWEATAKSIDTHLTKVETALGLTFERAEQQSLDHEEEKAMARALDMVGYNDPSLPPQQKVALVKELVREHGQLQEMGMHSTVAWESAAAEVLDRKTDQDVVAAPKAADAAAEDRATRGTPAPSKSRTAEDDYGKAWMHQQGGYDALTDDLKRSAQKSYQEWAAGHPEKAQGFDIGSYVDYVQEREGERREQAAAQKPKRSVADFIDPAAAQRVDQIVSQRDSRDRTNHRGAAARAV